MRTIFAVALLLTAAPLSANEGRVAEQTLAAMGLAGMETLADADGQTIRGQGKVNFTYANTISASAVPGAYNVSGSTAINPNVSGAGSASLSAGYYNPYFLPPMTSLAGARGFGFAAQ